MSARHTLSPGSIDDMNSWMLVDDDEPRRAPAPAPALPPHNPMNDGPGWMPPPHLAPAPPGHAWLVPIPANYPPGGMDPQAWLADYLPRPLPIPAPAIPPPNFMADATAEQLAALTADIYLDPVRRAPNPNPPPIARDYLAPFDFNMNQPMPLPNNEGIDMLARTREGAPSPRSIGFMSPPPAYRRYPVNEAAGYDRNINPVQDLAGDVAGMHVEARGYEAVADPAPLPGAPTLTTIALPPLSIPLIPVPPPFHNGPAVDNVWTRMLNAAVDAEGDIEVPLLAFPEIVFNARPGAHEPNRLEALGNVQAMDVEIGVEDEVGPVRALSPESTLGEDVAGVDENLGTGHADEPLQALEAPLTPQSNAQPTNQQLAAKLDQLMDTVLRFNSGLWARLESMQDELENLKREDRGRRHRRRRESSARRIEFRGARRPRTSHGSTERVPKRSRVAGAEAEGDAGSAEFDRDNDSHDEPDADNIV